MNYNYNSFDNYSDLSLGFDCEDVAVVPQMGGGLPHLVDDDAMSNMMFGNGNGNGRSSLDLFEFGGIAPAATEKFEDPFALAMVDIDFEVPVPAAEQAPAIPALGEFIPNALPEFIMESDIEGESDEDAAVPSFPVRAKSVATPKMTATTMATATKRSRSTKSHGYDRSAFAYADDWESDDGESDDEYVAPRRGKRGSRRPTSKSLIALEESDNLTREERVARWLAKKKTRVFKKTVRYESRKQYADKRPRIKGRFVSPEEYADYVAAKAAAQVVPSC